MCDDFSLSKSTWCNDLFELFDRFIKTNGSVQWKFENLCFDWNNRSHRVMEIVRGAVACSKSGAFRYFYQIIVSRKLCTFTIFVCPVSRLRVCECVFVRQIYKVKNIGWHKFTAWGHWRLASYKYVYLLTLVKGRKIKLQWICMLINYYCMFVNVAVLHLKNRPAITTNARSRKPIYGSRCCSLEFVKTYCF